MKTAWLLILLAGCGGSNPPSPATPAPAHEAAAPASKAGPAPAGASAATSGPPAVATVRAKLEQFADEMCQCKDTRCTQGVSDELTRWAAEMERHGGQDMKLSEDDTKQMSPIIERLAGCMGVIARGSGGDPKP